MEEAQATTPDGQPAGSPHTAAMSPAAALVTNQPGDESADAFGGKKRKRHRR